MRADGRRRTGGRWVRSTVAVAVLAGSVVLTAPAARAAAPTVTVTPAAGLVDYQPVQVTGSGFEPSTLLEVFECRAGAVDESDCDADNADFIDIDASGDVVPYTLYVDARIWMPDGTEVDCRTAPGACQIGVGFLLEAGSWPHAPLTFDPTAPLLPEVVATVTPSTGLVDDQVVDVHAEHLSFRQEAWTYLCAAGSTQPGERCDLDRAARGVPDKDGVIDLPLQVRSRFVTPLGASIDCATAPDGCEVVIAWSFSGPPDRQDEVAVSFAASATTTSASTSTTAVAAAATPVAGTARLTG